MLIYEPDKVEMIQIRLQRITHVLCTTRPELCNFSIVQANFNIIQLLTLPVGSRTRIRTNACAHVHLY